MSRKRLGRLQRIATIIPLALLSAAWTASVAGIGNVGSPASAAEGPGTVTDGTSVPEDAVEDPVSLTDPGSIEGFDGNEAGIISAASTNAIPAAALAAYQRAETVINSADESCNVTWQLIAAIGRVESDHGRVGGNVLNDDGVATPGIYGPALNGKAKTQAVSDTDAGVYDNDPKWDRAVGPMQFIPSTWQVVGVDADDDASRNPQDIDDAALAAAVYLCSGDGDLSTIAGQRAAVFRYNHSDAYVDLVIKIMNAYLEGDFTSVPNNSTAAGYVVPEPPSFNVQGPKAGTTGGKTGATGGKSTGTGGSTNTGGGTGTNPGTTPGGGDPTTNPGGGSTGGGTAGGGAKTITDAVGNAVDQVVPGAGDVVGQITKPVIDLIDGLLGPLTKTAGATACQNTYGGDLTKTVQLLNCLISYGLQP